MDRESLRNGTVYRSFSQSMPAGEGQDDIPGLMRRVADSIEDAQRLEGATVSEVVFNQDMDDDGDDWPYFTVYFTLPDDKPAEDRLPDDRLAEDRLPDGQDSRQ